jgi:hypothetical protein
MPVNESDVLKSVIPIVLASAGAAWSGVKLALNGTRKAIAESREESSKSFERVHEDMRRMDNRLVDVRERVARLEGAQQG